jgi:hypothetical protein
VTPAEQAALLALSDERDQWMARLLRAERESYELGRADGYRHGLEVAWGERKADALAFDPSAPTAAELELLRWGPGGRESHFIDPPTDQRQESAA